jgi:hypothetical protein
MCHSVPVRQMYVLFCMCHSVPVHHMYVLFCMYLSVPVRDMTIFSKCSSPMNYKKKIITTGFYYNCHIISINNLILVRIY